MNGEFGDSRSDMKHFVTLPSRMAGDSRSDMKHFVTLPSRMAGDILLHYCVE